MRYLPCCPKQKVRPGQDVDDMETAPENDTATFKAPGIGHALAVFLACALPMAATVAAFSLMGAGVQVYTTIADKGTNMLGNLCGFVSLAWLCVMFVVDWHKMCWPVDVLMALAFVALAETTAILKCILYPWAPLLVTLCICPAALVAMRASYCRDLTRVSFYKMIGFCAAACAVLLLLAWVPWTFATDFSEDGAQWTRTTKMELIEETKLVYDNIYSKEPLVYAEDCGPNKVEVDDAIVQAAVDKGCSAAATVWFTVWMAPLVVVIGACVVSVFSFLCIRCSINSEKDVVQMVQQFVCILVFLCMGMYCSIYASGVSVALASAFMAFFAASIFLLVVYVYYEVDQKILQSAAAHSSLVKYAHKGYQSDWCKALGIGALNMLLPLLLLLDASRNKVRKWRGRTSDSQSVGQRVAAELATWNWCSIFDKIVILGEVAVVLILGGKFTFILFSWLNEKLANVSFGVVLILVYLVGCLMFLLPPVPGSAVYMFAGIVIGKQAQDSIGFWPGVVVAAFLGLFAKLCACVGQYGIGFLAGQNVQVQKTIGVDTVPTRAIEKILRQRGLEIGKVAILVGGPDWPTSVTCGILRLNIPQMLLGTLPVFFASIAPQTLVGSLLTKETSGDDAAMWSAINTLSTGIAAVCQAAASLIAMYNITQTIEQHSEELSQYRPEHAAVAELTRQQAAYKEAFQEVSDWKTLTTLRKAVPTLAAACMLLSGFVFAADFILMEPMCLRKFAIKNSINAPFDDGGLNGNVLNVVRFPVGFFNILLFCFAVTLNILHNKELARRARRLMASPTTPTVTE